MFPLLVLLLWPNMSAATDDRPPQVANIVDRFIATLTEPVQSLLGDTCRTLDISFGNTTRQLCDVQLFTNGSYAENFNSTKIGIVSTLETIRLANASLRQQARIDLKQALRELRDLPHAAPAIGAGAGDYEHDVIRLGYVYQQYERGYRFVHREYRADVQCNYALMYGGGLAVENLTETDDTAHVSYQNIVQKVQSINEANRRDIAEQTEILLRNVAKSMRLIGRVMNANGH